MVKGHGLTGQKLVAWTQMVGGFTTLCQMYEREGNLLKLVAKVLSHPLFSKTSAPGVLVKVLEQFQEIGEQLKAIGCHLAYIQGKPNQAGGNGKPV